MERGIGKQVVGNMLTTAAVRFGDREAVYCSETGRRFSFRQLNERCNRLAHALLGLGLAKGDRVAFLTTNRAEIIEIFFALAKTGLVGLPLNYRLAPREIFDLMRTVDARVLVSESAFADVMQQAPAEVPGLRHRIVIGSVDGQAADYEDFIARAAASEPPDVVAEGDPFYFNLTSGTSGLPKCYVLTQYNNATLLPMFVAMDMSSQDVVLTVFPMYGRVGFAWAAAGMIYGNRHVIMNFEPARALQLIESERVTITNLVPTMGAMLLAHPELAARKLSSLRATVFAGALLPEAIRTAVVERICPKLYEYYGMQETGALVVSSPEDRAHRPDSIGRAILYAEVRVVDDQARTVAPGVIGEIVGRAPTGATAYQDNPAKTAETFRDGWIHTGDLGAMDEEGYLFIRGRKKDMIVTGGQNVFAADVEDAIIEFPDVVECAVIGLPDPVWGERVSAVVVVRPDSTLGADDLMRHCRERLASFKLPRQIILQQQPLPRTSNGKVQKFVLVERHRGAE